MTRKEISRKHLKYKYTIFTQIQSDPLLTGSIILELSPIYKDLRAKFSILYVKLEESRKCKFCLTSRAFKTLLLSQTLYAIFMSQSVNIISPLQK